MSQDNSTNQPPAGPPGGPDSQNMGQAVPLIPDHQLLKCIGRGSYGEVWLARNMMGEFRAVKIVYRKSFKEQRPFDRELSGIRKFEPISRSHEGFIDVLHVGINEEGGYFFYVMEAGDDQLTGSAIRPENYTPKTLGKCVSLQGSLSIQECIKLGLALSLALSELHKHGLVHRDVKPSNIIFVNGIPKLADIGLVAEATEARSYVGTEGFIPPEGPGSPQSDIYSLGKTLYEVSTGKDRHDFPELPSSLDDLPDLDGFLELNEVILHACKNDLKLRYQSAWDMHADLVALAAGKSVKRLRVLERRLSNLKRFAGASTLVLLVLAGVFYQVYREWKGRIESRERRVGSSIADGNQALKSGDLLGSLPYFADALRLDTENLGQTTTHRLRMASILAQCPKLTRVWSDASRVNHAEFSPDGKRILAAEFQGSVKIYDLESGSVLSHHFESTNWLWSATFSPDGRFAATANADGLVYVFEASNLEEICRLPHTTLVNSARFSPDGLRIVTACNDGFTRVWNLHTRKVELCLTQHARLVNFADFSPDGRLIVTTSQDNTARIWDAETGASRETLIHPGWVNYAAFSPDSKRVVTACADHKARVWDVESGKRIMPDLIHGDGVMSAEFSPDGRLILTASVDGTARLWLADSLQPLIPNPIIRHGERLLHAGFNRDGRQIITCGADGTIRVWDLAGIATQPHAVPYCISEDGTRTFSVTNNTVEVDDIASNKPAGPLIHAAERPEKAELSRDGRFVAVVTRAGQPSESQLQVWDSETGAAIGPAFTVTNGVSNAVPSIALSSDGKHLLTFGERPVQLWDVLIGTDRAGPLPVIDPVDCAIFNPDATRFATINGDKIEVLDTRTGHLCFDPLTFSQSVHAAEFSRDGSKLVGCCFDRGYTKCYAQVWSTADGQKIGPQLMHGDGVLCASFSPDGSRVVTASEDFTAIVWDTTTGRRLISPVEHDEKVRTAAFSPDGKWFVTASADKTARVWNADTGDPLTPPLRHLAELTNAVFLADGRRIVTHDANEECRVWPLAVDERPVEDLVILSRLLSGYTETRFGKFNSQGSDSLEVTWKRLRRKYPSTFETSTEEVEKWHEFQADDCAAHEQWRAEVFHLNELLALRPGDQSIINKLMVVNARLAKGN
jgi:WD40 repeat protein